MPIACSRTSHHRALLVKARIVRAPFQLGAGASEASRVQFEEGFGPHDSPVLWWPAGFAGTRQMYELIALDTR